ncbi:hypothetical protein GmHk_13G036478 [Glycine max]|nr:hypothetical protein GmHk_13G036478 [Glycine max]
MHQGNTTTNRVESARWALKRVLQNSLGDLYSVWDPMNNMITLQQTQIKASFKTSTHVVGHVYKKTLYKRLLGMVLRYALNEITYEFEHVRYFENNPFSCGCVLRTTLGLPCACENSMCPPPSKVNSKGAPKKLMKRSQRSTKRDPSYWEYVDAYHSVQNSKTSVRRTASSSEPPKPARMIPMLDQFAPFIQGFIEDVVDVKTDGNCGYRSIATLLGMGEESWALMRNKLIKELGKWSQDYIKLFGGTERFEQLRLSLPMDGLSKVSVDKWMDITEMRYVIASRYNKSTTTRFFYAPHDMRLSQRSLSLTAYGIVVVKQFISLGKTVSNYIRR